MKTMKKIILVVMGFAGFVLALHEDYRPTQDFWAIMLMLGAVALGLYWNRFGGLENEDEFL